MALGPIYTTDVNLTQQDGDLVVSSISGSQTAQTAVSFIDNPLASVTSVSFLSGPKGEDSTVPGPAGDDGYNPMTVSAIQPSNPQLGDLWYKP